MKTILSKRKSWWFGRNHNKRIGVEISGFNQSFHFGISVDGGDREVTLHLALFLGIWITFQGFLPESWYPTYHTVQYGPLPSERAFKLYWFEWAIWWNLWMKENEWNHTDPKWRRNSIHFDRILKGRHDCKFNIVETQEFLLPFFEGTYRVTVDKKERIDSYQRWFTKKGISFEVKAGYLENGEWVDCPIPHQGKGENSYDCGEDATYASNFSSIHLRYPTCYEAALYFWMSCMRTRERYGSKKWLPEKFKKSNYQIPIVSK